MRVLAIRGRNLASLADDFEVDFEAEPLGSSPIFAITGPTGAGKSTLLDAVCLALFRDVPRLRNAPAQGSIGRDGINPRDPRALMRHGASDAFAEVDFAMPDGQRYRARWSVARARTGTLKNDEHAFERLSDGERLGGTRRETEAAILAVIGLTADQFCRAALLAQGDFDAFVKADAGERAELLERLTGSGIYAELGKAAFARANEHKQQIAAITRDIAAQNGLDDAQRGELETELAAAAASIADLRARLGQLEEAERWERRGQELAALIAAAATSHKSAHDAQVEALPRRAALVRDRAAFAFAPKWQALERARENERALDGTLALLRAELAGHDERLQQAMAHDEASELALTHHREATRVLQDEIGRASQLDALLAQANRQAELHASTYRDAGRNAQEAEQTHVEAQRALDRATAEETSSKAWLAENASLAAIAGREDELAEVFREHSSKSARLSEVVGQSGDAEAALLRAQSEWNTAQGAVAQFTNALDERIQEREAAERSVPDAAIEANFAEQRDRLGKIELLAERAATAVTAASQTAADLKQTDARQQRNSEDLEANLARRAAIADELPGLITRRDEARGLAKRLAAAADDAALRLRQSLVPGEPCAVCGSSDHHLDLVSGVLGERVSDAHQEAQALASEVADREQEVAGLVASLVLLEGQQRELAADAQVQRDKSAEAEQLVVDLNSQIADAVTVSGLDAEAGKLAENLASARLELDAAIAAARAARIRRDDAINAERLAKAATDGAQEHLSKAKEIFDQRKQAHLDLEAEARSLRSDIGQLAGQLDRALKGTCHWPDLANGQAWLADMCRQWRQTAVTAEDAATRVATASALVSDTLIATRTQVERLEAARKAHVAAQAEADQRAAERGALLGGAAIADVNARLARETHEFETARNEARDQRGEAERTRSATQARLQQTENQVASAGEAIAGDAAALAVELAAASINEADVAKVAAAGSAVLDAEADALAQFDRTANSAALLLEQRQEDLTRHQATAVPDILGQALTEALQVARNNVETADRSHGVLQLRLREDDAVRIRTAALRSDLETATSAATVWLTLDGLIGDATGKKFRNFAQGLTLDRLLVHANARLVDLKPRYSLARGEGGDMIIEVIDNDMAGQVRGLHNLSGGERFLVSLALALGLAEMSTARGLRIESLFIDEGFGALDPESLGQALALLEHLHAGGRRVGVISHVEELKERIAAKVEIAPTGRGTSAVRVLVSG
jgi:exonuclease SbcC